MFRNLFKPDSALMITMTQITDCIFLSLFWVVGCIPMATAGASFAALYDSVYRTYRKGEKHSWQRFWQVFRTNWRCGIMPTVVVIALFALLFSGLVRIWNAAVAQQISFGLFSAAALLGVVLLGMISLIFPVMSRFETNFGGLIKNSFLLGFVNMPRTMGLGILNALTIFLCVWYVFPLFFLPALSALLGSLLIEPMFRPYMPEDPEKEAAE